MAKKYTPEFKADAIRYFEEHTELDNRQKAENLGLPYDTLYGWVRKYRREQRAGEGIPIKGNLTDEEKEILRLQRELRDTKDALEILKKAISILND